MYKWPQGKVIRVIALILVLVIVADLAWNGARSQFSVYYGDDVNSGHLRQAVFGWIYAVLALAVLVAGVVAASFHHVAVDFLIEVEQEMTRVTWPTSSELTRSTAVIAVMIVVVGAGILAVDWFNLHVLFGAIYGSRK
jgi:preprotein translocase SecE subunit